MSARRLAITLAAAALLAPAPAHAGTYDVYSCTFGGTSYPNNAWVADGGYGAPPAGTVDTQCNGQGDRLSAALNPGQTFNLGWAGLTFRPPSGTTISDFTVTVHHRHVDDQSNGSNNTAGLFRYGDGFFSGIGNLRAGDAARLGAEGHWWGNGATPTDVTRTLSRRDSAWAMEQTNGWAMILSSDCGDEPTCPMDAGDVQLEEILGSRVTINDPVVPSLTAVAAGQGLLAPGVRSGGEPITFSATDNTGIRRAEIVDVTDAANPVVVASEDYDAVKTDAGTGCDYTRPRPCPDVKDEKIAASPTPAGRALSAPRSRWSRAGRSTGSTEATERG